jgi:hypothetical protein
MHCCVCYVLGSAVATPVMFPFVPWSHQTLFYLFFQPRNVEENVWLFYTSLIVNFTRILNRNLFYNRTMKRHID